MKSLNYVVLRWIFLCLLTSISVLKDEKSQAKTPIIKCKARHSQEIVTSQQIQYQGRISCDVGIPQSIKLFVYKSNVNYPSKWYLVETKEFNCPPQPFCQTPYYVLTMNQTKFLRIKGYFSGITTEGNIKSVEKNAPDIVYNDRGEPYPEYKVSTKLFLQGYVPFPKLASGKSYDRCDDDPSRNTPPACKRKDIKRPLIDYYTNVLTIPLPGPINKIEGHHVKPLRWGGGNSITNGVLLPENVHDVFSRWWTGFSSRKW